MGFPPEDNLVNLFELVQKYDKMEDIHKELYSYQNGFPNHTLTASYRETALSTDLTLQFQYTEAEYVAAVHYYNRSFDIQTYLMVMGVVLLAGLYFWFSTSEPVVFFLIYGKQMYTVIPKRVFESVSQETQFRELLKRKITPQIIEF